MAISVGLFTGERPHGKRALLEIPPAGDPTQHPAIRIIHGQEEPRNGIEWARLPLVISSTH